MSGTKILWGQIALVLSLIVLSWWAATLVRAVSSLAVYAPPLFFWWWYVFDAYAPNVFARGAWIAGSGGVLAFVAAVALSVHRAREARKIETYGSARWTEPEEIAQAALLDPDGVVLGCYRKTYLQIFNRDLAANFQLLVSRKLNAGFMSIPAGLVSFQSFNWGCHIDRHKGKRLFCSSVYETQFLTSSVNDTDVDTKLAHNSTD